MNRRELLRLSLMLGGSTLMSSAIPGLSWALDQKAQGTEAPILVFIFLRGAMDGLSMLPPIQDGEYFSNRPNIQIPAKGEGAALNFKEGFGLHPALGRLQQIVNSGSGLFLFGAGSPANTRSHFDAQDWMESGVITMTDLPSGFLGRASQMLQGHSASTTEIVALQSGLPRSLRGASNALAFPNFKALHINGPLTRDRFGTMSSVDAKNAMDPAFHNLYTQSKDPLFRGPAISVTSGAGSFEKAEDQLALLQTQMPKAALGKSLAHILAMIKAKAGLRIAVTEMGGWDTHVNQGNAVRGSLRDRLAELDESIGFFWQNLGPQQDKVCLVAVTEFGRTVKENGDRGTDHGHGSTALVLHHNVRKNGVLHHFQGLKKELLYEGRDLPVTIDSREVMTEILRTHMKLANTESLFPQFVPSGKDKIFI